MAALFLAPLYILINAYVVRWMIRWMGACHRLFQTMAFRASFIGVYIILATALLTGFLIKSRPTCTVFSSIQVTIFSELSSIFCW